MMLTNPHVQHTAQVGNALLILMPLIPSHTQEINHLILILRIPLINACFSISSKVKIGKKIHATENLPLTSHCMFYTQAARHTQI